MPASLVIADPRPAADPAPAGRLESCPKSSAFLRRCGLHDSASVMELSGEVVSGHPDRHVRRVVLTDGDEVRVGYLKREHTASVRARVRNLVAGAGFVARCTREARTLGELHARGLPAPRPLAWGSDGTGRAFLLVEELTGAVDLPRYLQQASAAERRRVAEALGRALAELHAAGVTTPDLAAKHVFVGPGDAVTLLDWQGATVGDRPRPVWECVRPLATLHASLRPDLATLPDRLRALRAYLRHRGETVSVAAFARTVRSEARGRSKRSSVRDQQTGPSLRLVWLAGEEACAVPGAVPHWPAVANGRPFYPGPPDGHAAAEEAVDLGPGAAGVVVRFHSAAPFSRLLAALRERPWRSPGAEAARLLAHLARHGIPAPTLLGFGQKLTGSVRADSFVFFDPPAGCAPVAVALCRTGRDLSARRALLRECGRLLRRVHDAGLRLTTAPTGRPVLAVGPGGEPRVGSPFVVRRSKRLCPGGRRADLRLLFVSDMPALPRPDRLRVVRAYLGGDRPDESLARGVV